jgi:hypothetical protein
VVGVVAGILRVGYALNFFLNAILIFEGSFQLLEFCHSLEELIVYIYFMILSCILLLKHSIFTASTPRAMFFLVCNKGGYSSTT